MGKDVATQPQRYGAVGGARAPFPVAPPSKWRLFDNFVIFLPICLKFGWKVDRKMGNDVATPPQHYGAVRGAGAPFPAAPPSKWRSFNNSVIFRPIFFKFEFKVDRRMGNYEATPPRRYGTVCGAAAPFRAAPPTKWRPFNNSVIF